MSNSSVREALDASVTCCRPRGHPGHQVGVHGADGRLASRHGPRPRCSGSCSAIQLSFVALKYGSSRRPVNRLGLDRLVAVERAADRTARPSGGPARRSHGRGELRVSRSQSTTVSRWLVRPTHESARGRPPTAAAVECQRGPDRCDGGRPDLLRLVLDPSVPGEVLGELLVPPGNDSARPCVTSSAVTPGGARVDEPARVTRSAPMWGHVRTSASGSTVTVVGAGSARRVTASLRAAAPAPAGRSGPVDQGSSRFSTPAPALQRRRPGCRRRGPTRPASVPDLHRQVVLQWQAVRSGSGRPKYRSVQVEQPARAQVTGSGWSSTRRSIRTSLPPPYPPSGSDHVGVAADWRPRRSPPARSPANDAAISSRVGQGELGRIALPRKACVHRRRRPAGPVRMLPWMAYPSPDGPSPATPPAQGKHEPCR